MRRRAGLPRWMWVPAGLGLAFFVIPIAAVVARTPWSRVSTLAASDIVLDALRLSFVTSVAATVIAIVIGTPLAVVLARVAFPGRALVRGVVLLPLVLPPVVSGSALLFAFGRRGVIGEPIADVTGFIFPFSIWGAILAAAFVAMPFLVITVEGAVGGVDERYVGAAATLGASDWITLRRVILPMVRPSLLAGVALTWARALGEFGATITFAGNLQGRTQTMPLAVFVAMQQDRDAAVAVSLILIVVALAVIVALRRRWWPA